MSKLFFNLTWKEGPPTLQEVCQRYGLKLEEVDAQFGVIAVDPADNLYTILVEEAAAQRLQGFAGAGDQELKGPYSNPRIEPFGPPREPPPPREPDS